MTSYFKELWVDQGGGDQEFTLGFRNGVVYDLAVLFPRR